VLLPDLRPSTPSSNRFPTPASGLLEYAQPIVQPEEQHLPLRLVSPPRRHQPLQIVRSRSLPLLSFLPASRSLAPLSLVLALTGRDLDRLVLDYLIVEGYREAAEEFIREAAVNQKSADDDDDQDGDSSESDDGMDQDVDLSSSRARMPPVSQRKRKVPELELDGIEVRSFAPPRPPPLSRSAA
jgi:hypothetical protein